MSESNSSKFGEKIKEIRESRGYSLRHLAYKTDISYSYISKLERGQRNTPKIETLEKLADGLDMSKLEMFKLAKVRNSENLPNNVIQMTNNNTVQIPVLGSIACGEPITAEQNIESYFPMISGTLPSGSNFCLHCKGDSMEPKIKDGALVIIHEQPEVEDGEIAAVLIDNEATLKKIQHVGKQVLLMPINDKYKPIALDGSKESRILGKAVKAISDL